MSKKLDFHDVKLSFEVEGYTLISKEYKNNKSKLRYICPNGHTHSINWNNWSTGYRCYYCNGNISPTIDDVRQSFEMEGYTLINKNYINNRSKLKYICKLGHSNEVTWDHWVSGVRCGTCFYIYNSGINNPSWKGGVSFETYCGAWKDKEYKQDIKDRDGNRCLNPYCASPNKRDLTIHHINYNKKDCKPSNLITVCRSCNSKANTDRDWHKSWYNSILCRRGARLNVT